MTTIFGLAIAAIVTEKFGRRRAITILTMPVVISWLAMYLAQRMLVFMIARIILGLCFGGVLSLCVLSTAEYTAPKVRGFYLHMIVTAGAALGVAISNILGILLHWRTVAWMGIIPAFISALIPYLWVESPTWLASKGRFEECATAFKALHGNEKESEAELHLLIKIETQKQSDIGGPSQSYALILRKLTTALRQKYLWKIAVLCTCLHVFRVATCRILICTFVITMIQNITGTSDILLFTLVADGCLVLGSFSSCFLIDRMKTRTLLFYSGIAANIILIALSISLHYYKVPWVNCILLGLFIVIINAGPYPILESLFGEIYPLEIKSYCMAGFGIVGTVLLFLSIRLALPLFESIGYHGVFLLNAGLEFMCLSYLWFFLPETKGRTLQEIELYFKNNVFDGIDNLIKDEETKLCA